MLSIAEILCILFLPHSGRRGQFVFWPKGCKSSAKVNISFGDLSLLSHSPVIPVTTSLLGARAGSWLMHSPTEVEEAKSAFGPGDVSWHQSRYQLCLNTFEDGPDYLERGAEHLEEHPEHK